jgi:hypothetical protein
MLKHEADCPAYGDAVADICTCGALMRWAQEKETQETPPRRGEAKIEAEFAVQDMG